MKHLLCYVDLNDQLNSSDMMSAMLTCKSIYDHYKSMYYSKRIIHVYQMKYIPIFYKFLAGAYVFERDYNHQITKIISHRDATQYRFLDGRNIVMCDGEVKINKLSLEHNIVFVDLYKYTHLISLNIRNCHYFDQTLLNSLNQLQNLEINTIDANIPFQWPPNLIQLSVSHVYGENNVFDILPNTLQSLELGDTNDVQLNNLPKNLITLQVGIYFNSTIIFPPNIKTFTVGSKMSLSGTFNRPINIPPSMIEMTLGYSFSKSLNLRNTNIQKLYLGDMFQKKIRYIPETLQILKVGNNYHNALPKIPLSLKTLFLGYNNISTTPCNITCYPGRKKCFLCEYDSDYGEPKSVRKENYHTNYDQLIESIGDSDITNITFGPYFDKTIIHNLPPTVKKIDLNNCPHISFKCSINKICMRTKKCENELF